jgi:DNA-binding protein YbaB
MSEIKATRSVDGVTVEVYPGGALSALSLTRRAVALGSTTLAATIVAAVAEATAVANQRTKSALRAALTGLGEADLARLGLTQEPALTERAESTTPETWRTP